jgi:ketosteroid isomerase-like protein
MTPLLAALLSLPALLQAPSEHPVVGLDRSLNQLYQKRDAEAASAFLLDSFVLYVGGPAVDKATFLSRVRDPEMAMTAIESTDVKVHAHGDTAVLAGELRHRGTFKGRSFDQRMKFTATWTRAGETWKVLALHLVPLPEPVQTSPQPVPKKN